MSLALKVANSEHSLPSWLFENAINILQEKDLQLLPALEQFLELNTSLITDPFKYISRRGSGSAASNNTKISQADIDKGSIEINKTQYKLSSENISAANVEFLAEKLDIDSGQALKVILLVNDKKLLDLNNVNKTNHINLIPKGSSSDSNPEGSVSHPKNLIYAVEILKEKRQVIRLIVLLFKNSPLNEYLEKLTDKILLNSKALVDQLIDNILSTVKKLQTIDESFNDSTAGLDTGFVESLKYLIKKESLLIIADYLKLLIQLLIPINAGSATIKKWFDMLNQTFYLKTLESVQLLFSVNFSISEYLKTVESLSAISTLLFLGLDVQENIFNIKLDYLNEVETYKFIDQSISNSEFVSPIVVYSWSIVNYARYLLFEEFPTQPEVTKFLGGLGISLEDYKLKVGSIIYLVENLKKGIFNSLQEAFKALNFDNIYKTILASYIKIVIPFVKLNFKTSSIFSKLLQSIPKDGSVKVDDFILDDSFLNLLQLNKLKSPENVNSFNSFLNLLSVDSKLAVTILNNLDTYLHFFKIGELEYEHLKNPDASSEQTELVSIERQHNDFVVLTKDATVKPLYEPSSSSNSLVIEAGTKGKLIANSNININAIVFNYNYSGWALIGKVFENLVDALALDDHKYHIGIEDDVFAGNAVVKRQSSSSNSDNVNVDDEYKQKDELLLNILNLLICTLDSVSKEESDSIIKDFQQTTSLNFFELLFKLLNTSLSKKNLPKLTIFNKLLISLMGKYSRQVWSILIKSNYFEVNDTKTTRLLLNSIFALERTKGSFEFSISLINLTDSLIIDSLSIDSTSTENSISLKAKDEIISKLVSIFISSFENFTDWTFNELYQKFKTGILILELFSKILFTIYSIDFNKHTKVTSFNDKYDNSISVLKNSGIKIIDSFLSKNKFDSLSVKPFLAVIDSLIGNSLIVETGDNLSLWFENFIYCLFDFNTLLISLRSMLMLDVSVLESEIFVNLPQLVKVYLKFPNLKLKIMNLLSVLVNSDYGNEKPPSLLAHMGDNYSKILLNSIVVDLEGSLIEYSLKNALYDFFSNVMEKNQEGLSVLLLTGYDVHERLNQSKDSKDKSSKTLLTVNKTGKSDKSILRILKDNVINLDKYPNSAAIHLLDAISFAFNSWATAQKMNDDDEKFIKSLADYFDKNYHYDQEEAEENGLEDLSDTVDKTIKRCYKIKLLSSIGEILALYLFSCSNEKVIRPILNLLESKNFLQKQAHQIFRIHNYDSKLHLNAHKNFNKYFTDFNLDDFRRTSLNKFRRYGVGTVYNLSLMDKLFGSHYEWNDFMRHDVILTSLNLQYVSAQTNLVKSWGALISSYIRFKSSDPTKEFFDLASLFLSINNDEGIPAPSFKDIYLERIELAFFLIFNVSTSKTLNKTVTDEQISTLFTAVLTSLLSDEVNFLLSLSNNNVQMYRSLLRILLITLNLCSNKAYLLEKNPNLVIDLFNKIIAYGTKVIIASVQNVMSASSSNSNISSSNNAPNSSLVINKIEDLLLITSIFKSFVAINFSSKINETLSILLDSNETIKYVLELYAYSNSMLVDGEPVFADFALIYIIELLSIDVVAERLLSYGLFSILVNSPISIEIQKGNIRADQQPRYHHIWSNGLLTIVLLLLSKFGPRVIPDICIFLKQFEKQLSFTLKQWSEDSLIVTLPTIHETSQLIILHKALNLLNFKEYIGVNLNNENVSSLQFFPGLDTEKQRQSLIDSFNHLLTHPKFLQSRIVVTNTDEQVGVEDESTKGRSRLVNRLINEIRELSESLSE